MLAARLKELLAIAIIGDSVLSLLAPRRHIGLWRDGPQWWERLCEPFERYPNMTRVLGAAGIVFGLWLADRQQPPRALPRDGRFRGARLPRRLMEALR